MIKYIQTTTMILLCCFLFSIAWGWFCYWRLGQQVEGEKAAQQTTLLPGLVLAPLSLLVFFHFLGINLIYPIHADATSLRIFIAALVPALVLSLASGLFFSIRSQILSEAKYWNKKSFVTFMQATGQDPKRRMRRLVLSKALCQAWLLCLPWLFGELIVIESVFNAPGLALDAWHQARMRNFGNLAVVVAWLAALYVCALGSCYVIHYWLGKRLESYQ